MVTSYLLEFIVLSPLWMTNSEKLEKVLNTYYHVYNIMCIGSQVKHVLLLSVLPSIEPDMLCQLLYVTGLYDKGTVMS